MNPFMKKANELAKKNLFTDNGGPFGAVIVKDGVIVGRGNNHVLAHNDPTAHAEIMAIRSACRKLKTYDLTGCVIYTSCYPCPMCLSAIIWANIKVAYYGNTKEDAARIGFRDDFIYRYIQKLASEQEDTDTLQLIPLDRNQTLEAFDLYQKDHKTIY